ncbi:PLL family lectin [Spirosoma gilvum]
MGRIIQVTTASNEDGRLEVFFLQETEGTSDLTSPQIFHYWQTRANNGWAGPAQINTTIGAKQMVVEKNQDGRLELFYVGLDDAIYHKWQTVKNTQNPAQWSADQALTNFGRAYLNSYQPITVKQNQDKRLELFYVASDKKIYHQWQSIPNAKMNEWSGEQKFITSALNNFEGKYITVGSNADGRLELFFPNEFDSSALYNRWQTVKNTQNPAQWSAENRLGSNDLAVFLTVGQNQDGRLELFYIGTNSALYHKWQTVKNTQNPAQWSAENRLGSNDFAQDIVIGQNEDGRLELFYVGLNNNIYHRWQTVKNTQNPAQWTGEQSFHINVQNQRHGSIAIGSNLDKRLELFYIGEDHSLYHIWQVAKNGGWSAPAKF